MSRNTDDNWIIGNYKTNRYREVAGVNGEDDYIEVEIYGQGEYHIGQIDKEFLDRFTERTWFALKQGKNFYMASGKTKNFPVYQRFHQLVLTDVDMVEHENGNELDNRKKNLIDGLIEVKQNIQALRDENIVSFEKRDKSWIVTWYENKKQTKYFSIEKYGSDEKAKQEAIKYHQFMNKITGCANED